MSREDDAARERALEKQARLQKEADTMFKMRSAQGEHTQQQYNKEGYRAGNKNTAGIFEKPKYTDKVAGKTGRLANATKSVDAAKLAGKAGAVSAGVGALGDAGIIDTSSEGGGALSGAASGAAAGAAFGPYGAAIGGVIGGVTGAIGAGEARKKKLAQIEAKKQQRLGEIAQNKADRLQQGFQSMGSALSGLFTQGR